MQLCEKPRAGGACEKLMSYNAWNCHIHGYHYDSVWQYQVCQVKVCRRVMWESAGHIYKHTHRKKWISTKNDFARITIRAPLHHISSHYYLG